ncbi:MAG: hypothetical protein JWN86_4229 [Planctomycetota bacterium]|nr:hypothetical protein [Planctomycetota bacterium]
MAETPGAVLGRVISIWRYPVKSMLGEELDAVEVTEHGLLGDRAYALIDAETGKVASAKNPRRWPTLFDFKAVLAEPVSQGSSPPPARITLPSGEVLTTDAEEIESRLSEAVGRPVRLARSAFEGATAEGYWPDHEWLPQPDEQFEFPLPAGGLFDGATVHLVTTRSLDRLRAAAPESRFDVRRFRPNFVIDPTGAADTFAEDGWIGQTLQVGGVLLRIDRPTPRCVMTTLAQGDLPKDSTVLRTAVRENGGNVGVYATVIRHGLVKIGDTIGVP